MYVGWQLALADTVVNLLLGGRKMLFLPRAHSCLVTELLEHFVIGHQFEFYIKSQHACRGHQLHCSRICGKKIK